MHVCECLGETEKEREKEKPKQFVHKSKLCNVQFELYITIPKAHAHCIRY